MSGQEDRRTGVLCPPDLILIIMRDETRDLSHLKLSRLASLRGIDFDQQQTIERPPDFTLKIIVTFTPIRLSSLGSNVLKLKDHWQIIAT